MQRDSREQFSNSSGNDFGCFQRILNIDFEQVQQECVDKKFRSPVEIVEWPVTAPQWVRAGNGAIALAMGACSVLDVRQTFKEQPCGFSKARFGSDVVKAAQDQSDL